MTGETPGPRGTKDAFRSARRAGTTTPYYWVESLNGDRASCDGNYPCRTKTKGVFLEETTPKCYAPNARGLYDVSGLVNEWTLDWRGATPKEPSKARAVSLSAKGASCAAAAGTTPRACRFAYRDFYEPDDRCEGLGFRVLLCRKNGSCRVV